MDPNQTWLCLLSRGGDDRPAVCLVRAPTLMKANLACVKANHEYFVDMILSSDEGDIYCSDEDMEVWRRLYSAAEEGEVDKFLSLAEDGLYCDFFQDGRREHGTFFWSVKPLSELKIY